MNRITNKEYLIDITIHSLQTQQPQFPAKVKCEIHYADDSYLRFQVQPMIRSGVAIFCDERMRIPFSSEVSLVFKIIKPNKKESFLGHYQIDLEKMLSEKQYYAKEKNRLEESQSVVDFECRIIDKQLLCESDDQEPDLQSNALPDKSIITCDKKIKTQPFVNRPFSDIDTPILFKTTIAHQQVSIPPEDYSKLVREAEEVVKKKQLYSQRQSILGLYSRDRYGMLRTEKIKSLQGRLNEARKQKMNSNLIIYILVGIISLLIGTQI